MPTWVCEVQTAFSFMAKCKEADFKKVFRQAKVEKEKVKYSKHE